MQSPTNSSAVAFGASLMLLAMVCQEVGASFAVMIFPQVGAVGAVALRLVLSACVLGLIARPRVRGLSKPAWGTVVAYGLSVAAMNTSFYLALERLPLGIAVAIEVLGPLVLSVVLARRWLNAVWVVLACAGVVLLTAGPADFDPLGVGFAVIAAVMWALYIVSAQRAGTEFPGISGLAIAMTIGALAILPVAAVTTGTVLLRPHILLIGLGIALLSTAIPYALELFALRRIPASVFSILLACAPVVAALAGLVVLGQALLVGQWAGILLVSVACVGAVWMTTRGVAKPR